MSGFLKLWRLVSTADKASLGKVIPIGFSLIYILVNLGVSIFESIRAVNILPFIHTLSTSLFALDYGIQEQVNIALTNPSQFGFLNVFVIVSALLILYFFVRVIEKGLSFLMTNTSAQGLGTFTIAILLLAVIELISVLLTHQKLVVPGGGVIGLIYNLPTIFGVLNANTIALKEFLYNNI